jgi:hypothetical protein
MTTIIEGSCLWMILLPLPQLLTIVAVTAVLVL